MPFFMHCRVLIRGGVWPAPLLLGVYCVSTTNNVGALTKVMGGGFGAPAKSAHNTVR